MGREIRRVIPNWEHPKKTKYNPWKRKEETSYVPLYDESYEKDISEWVKNHLLWENGTHPDQQEEVDHPRYFAEADGNPPDIDTYRPDWREEDATWFQLYETVSEGTPLSPAFSTKQELINYLCEHGDFWQQCEELTMSNGVWARNVAEKFVNGSGWAPSLIVGSKGIRPGYEAMEDD